MGITCDPCYAADIKSEKIIQHDDLDKEVYDMLENSFINEYRNMLPPFDYRANAPSINEIVKRRFYKGRLRFADNSVYDGEWNT